MVTNFFPAPSINLKLGLRVGGRLLIATYLDQSNYLANQKHGAVNTYELTVFIRLFNGFSPVLKGDYFPRSLPLDSLNLTDEPCAKFSVQGNILSIGAGALQIYMFGVHCKRTCSNKQLFLIGQLQRLAPVVKVKQPLTLYRPSVQVHVWTDHGDTRETKLYTLDVLHTNRGLLLCIRITLRS